MFQTEELTEQQDGVQYARREQENDGSDDTS